MDSKVKRKNTFSAISINQITAERFREYSKIVCQSHSETVDAMIDFFEKTRISPKDEVAISFYRFQKQMMGRFDFIEELLRSIEREHLIPTKKMLESLFDGTAIQEKKQPLLIEKKNVEQTAREKVKVDAKVYQGQIAAIEKHCRYVSDILSKVTKVQPTFGKASFKLNMDDEALEKIHQELNEFKHK